MITLPPTFQFSASSLQDFTDCARRFQLRYLMEQDWPAPAAEPLADAERAYELGRRFHLTMERYWRGLPVERERLDPALQPWWDAFVEKPPPGLPATQTAVARPEVSASALIEGQRMTATFDLLTYDPAAPDGPVTIFDWKTSKPTPRRILDRRLQTIIYPLMIVTGARGLIGREIAPGAVRLVYWFTDGTAEIFEYSAARYEEDRRGLSALLSRLLSIEVEEWPLTSDERRCRLCQYRSLCDRGRIAGLLDEETDDGWPDVEELRGVIAEAAALDEFVL